MKKVFFDNIQIAHLTEAIDGGNKYKCIIIKPGVTSSANTYAMHEGKKVAVKKNYTKEVLKHAAESGLFEGTPMILRTEADHLSRKNQDIENIVGYFSETKWDETSQAVIGTFNLKQSKGLASNFKSHLKQLWESTKDIGLSITGFGEWIIEKISNEFVATVTSLEDITSVDPCRVGNAGGRIIDLVESELNINTFKNQNKNNMLNDKLRTALFLFLQKKDKIKTDATESDFSDDQLMGLATLAEWAEVQKAEGVSNDPPPPPDNTPPADDDDATAQIKKTAEKYETLLAEAQLKKILSESKLNQKAKDLIESRYKALNWKFNERDLKCELSETAKLFAEASNSGFYRGVGSGFSSGMQSPRLGMEQDDKYQLGLEWLLSNDPIRQKFTAEEKKQFQEAGVTGLTSFKEFYKELTGDYNISGKEGKGKLAESITSSTFPELLGTSMHKSVIRAFKMSAYQDSWRKLVTIVPRQDFKTNTIIYEGGYGNLPTVAEAAAYTAATTPAEQANTYAITKKGYTEDITREALKNDDMGALQKIPFMMGEAAARTLYEFVFNLILSNPTMAYDSIALFHASHNNLTAGAAVLSSTTLSAGRVIMANQTDLTNGKKLGIMPKYLLVPIDLAETAYNLTTPAYGQNNQVSTFVQTWQLEPIVVVHATDATDWFLVGDPARGVPTIEIGFLDNQQEPSIFVQDAPTQGNVFTNDKITFKIRHEYSGAIENHRGFYKYAQT